MKILQITLNYFPEETGISVTSTEVAEWFARRNHEVSVITGLPFYPQWRIRDEYRDRRKRTEILNGVKVLRVWLYVPAIVTTWRRIAHELSFAINIIPKVLVHPRPDVLIVVSPPLTVALLCVIVGFIRRIPVFLNVKDLVPDAAVELGMIKNKRLIKALLKMENFVYNRVGKIGTIGRGMAKRIAGKGVSEKKITILPDTASADLLKSRPAEKPTNPFLNHHGLNNDFLVIHSGNIGVKQGVEVIIRCAKILMVERSIHFCVIGDGAERSKVESLVRDLGLNNVTLLPLQPREWLGHMYNAANVLLLTQKKEVVDIVVPSKLISMMAAGSFIIASVHPESEVARLIEEAKCGVIVPPEDPQALADTILFYSENRHLTEPAKQRSKMFVASNFDRQKTMLMYEEELRKLAKRNRS